MNLIKPPYLNEGDTVAIIAPAGAVEYDEIIKAQAYLERRNLRVTLGRNIFKSCRYMAGTDEERVSDLHEAFENPEVNAIICARGGYGSIRLIKMIDFDLIRRNPKIFCGYSDITALSLMFAKHSDLITFSGPMAQSDFNDVTEFTANSFFNVLSGGFEEYMSTETYRSGNTEGIIWGGNLSTIVSLCGIDFIPEEDFIFFTEDLNEAPYRIDKMLTQLVNIKEFRKHCKGIVFGEFLDCGDENWVTDILLETANILEVPAYGGFKFTHAADKQTVPIGAYGILQDGILSYKMS
ncbi:LD-carboxypeptidase [Spirochaetes bacterium]|uniref:LD-carboxypeptidase n=1 Tax=Candidatus Scatousia excrementipullorum TaxID=2840936 RepID=A0A9D9DPA6_9BACT|nr:LD-carboxypeptidase [Candidatus Scatousia excrementipullorum]